MSALLTELEVLITILHYVCVNKKRTRPGRLKYYVDYL